MPKVAVWLPSQSNVSIPVLFAKSLALEEESAILTVQQQPHVFRARSAKTQRVLEIKEQLLSQARGIAGLGQQEQISKSADAASTIELQTETLTVLPQWISREKVELQTVRLAIEEHLSVDRTNSMLPIEQFHECLLGNADVHDT